MKEYIKKFVHNMYRIYGYNIIEQKAEGLVSTWGLSRRCGNGGIEAVFFSAPGVYQRIDFEKIYSDLLEKYSFRSIQIVIVMAYRKKNDQSVVMNISYPHCGLILVDLNSKQIISSVQVSDDIFYKICDCTEKSFRRSTNSGKINLSSAKFTYFLIAVNIIVFLISAILSKHFFTIDSNVLVAMGAKVDYLISSGEYYRLVSCMFLHGGIMHIAFNMYALFAVGPFIERIYGSMRYAFIYLFSGILASVFSYIFSPSMSIGASGAIFGLFGAALVFGLKMKKGINREYVYNIGSVIIINLLIGFSASNIDNFGHIGGLVGGILISLVLNLKKTA